MESQGSDGFPGELNQQFKEKYQSLHRPFQKAEEKGVEIFHETRIWQITYIQRRLYAHIK